MQDEVTEAPVIIIIIKKRGGTQLEEQGPIYYDKVKGIVHI